MGETKYQADVSESECEWQRVVGGGGGGGADFIAEGVMGRLQ